MIQIGSAVEELEQAYSDDQANVDNLNGLVHALRVELEEERAVKAKLAAKVAEAEKKAQEAISEKMKSDSRVVEVEARVTTMEAKIAEERKTLKGTLKRKRGGDFASSRADVRGWHPTQPNCRTRTSKQ